MRRAVPAAIATLVGLIALLSFKSSPGWCRSPGSCCGARSSREWWLSFAGVARWRPVVTWRAAA